MTMTKVRESNFELLRIFAIMGVVILHSSSYFFSQYAGESLFYDITWHGLHAVFVSSVNIFLMITGFFMCSKDSVSVEKPFSLYLQNVLFSLGLYVLTILKGSTVFSLKSFVFRFVPSGWFLVIYITLFLIIPFINVVICKISVKGFRTLLVVTLFCFSFWAIGIDIIQSLLNAIQTNGGGLIGYSPIGQRGSQEGYTIVNFVLMYLIGAYIRKTDFSLPLKFCLPITLLNTLLIYIWTKFDYTVGEEYCNPLVILNAVLIFLLFKNVRIKSKVINRIAAACFTVYIFHITIEHKLPRDLCYGNNLLALPKFFLAVFGMYAICWILWEIYNATINKLLKKYIFDRHTVLIRSEVE